MGFEPRAAGWEARMLSLCYAGPLPGLNKLNTRYSVKLNLLFFLDNI